MNTVVLHGGTVVPCDIDGEVCAAIAYDEDAGRIVAVGEEAAVRQAAGADARAVDLAGATVLPGLIDTHPHLMHFGVFAEPLVDLEDAADHDDIVGRIAAKAAGTEPGDWVMTTPVGEPHYFLRRSWRDLAEGELPDRHVLDRGTSRHPVVIQAWAPTTPNLMALNTAALAVLGITGETPKQVGRVQVERDAAGEPTGRLFGSVNTYYSGEPFTEQLMRQIPLLDLGAIGPGTERAMRAYNALGVTTVYEGHAMDFPLIAAYQWLHSEGRLTVRVLCCPEAQPYGLPTDVVPTDAEFMARLEQAAALVQRTDPMLRVDGVSIGRGGPCGPGFTLMREPYRGPYGESTTGRDFVGRDRTRQAIRFAHEHDLRLNIVTAGTREHDENLEDLEAAAIDRPLRARDRAWLLQHLYFVDSEHARRMADLGLDLTTSMSFSWGKGELVRERVGERHLEDLIPLRRLLDSGMHVACGSDWGPKNIFEHIALAVVPSYAGSGAPARTPGVTPAEALAMWTREAAHVLRWDDVGTLEPGHHADLCIVDRNPLRCDSRDLAGTEVRATVLGGTVVHGSI